MQTIEIKSDSDSLQVLKNIDFILRTQRPKTVLITADYPEENHANIAESLTTQLSSIYRTKIYLMDLSLEEKELDFNLNDPAQAQIYLDELLKHNDYIFIIQNVNKNITTSKLPEFDVDAALIVRTDKSIGINKSRFITNLIVDADIKILGLIQGGK